MFSNWYVTALLVVAQASIIHCQNSQASVTIANGTIVGSHDSTNKIDKFLGIPYAEPPVGNLRLRQAVPLQQSFGTIQATAFGESCYGSRNPTNSSEDCLTLNIWRPSSISQNETLPVLVWIYGGGFTNGYTADPRFEGTDLVRISSEIQKPVILLSLNYRLGPFGFLNGLEMSDLGLLNIGLLDQRLALHWIQENIAAFGGDPTKVTLAGESAGAVSIYSHMMAYGGRNDSLFRGGILESGGAFPLTLPNTTAFQSTFDSLITNTTCVQFAASSSEEKLDCIRQLPVEEFRSKVGSSTGQSIDGDFTRTSLRFALPDGSYLGVPTIVGTNTDEGTTSAPTNINTTDQLFEPLADGYFRPQRLPNDVVSTLLSLYPTDPALGCPYNTGDVQLSSGKLDKMACSIFGDLVQIGPARFIAQTLAQHGHPVYRYRFNQLPANATDVAEGITTGLEQSYVFSNLLPDNAWDRALAYRMSAAWASFAHGLDPNWSNDGSFPAWPQYASQNQSMVFNGYGSSIEEDTYRGSQIEYIISTVLPDGAA
ncbi:hypothetical protein PFICI_04952 [Pestalotiopsis fici W106-1]|uniref:Carboxylic ester hydrolase n=1 Tax=Pestalotiopsis fici (strain W106-1 / CGMCC3.15140) TaxID=1229662 RepID=W3XD16_PESFW|nr:uncharacterized protein PFICI_04952 [Pestalotiopsis fici W106-1]ETS83076.1 hypothetical protein PFICI_04952 [Pestalotiopsis fici W106-1]